MVPLNSEFVELSSIARNEVVSQTPGGGLRSPAARPLRSEPIELARQAALQTRAESGEAQAAVVIEQGSPWWRRVGQSVWAPIALKAGAAAVGLACLALVGAASLRQSPSGVAVSSVGTEWIAGGGEEPSESAPLHGADVAPPALAQVAAAAPAPAPAPIPCATESAESAESAGPAGVTKDGRVILNLANAAELIRLPGVGPRRADQIVALRERLGKFRRVTDLLRVKGIGPKSLRKLKSLVVLDPEVEPEPDPAPQEARGDQRGSSS